MKVAVKMLKRKCPFLGMVLNMEILSDLLQITELVNAKFRTRSWFFGL